LPCSILPSRFPRSSKVRQPQRTNKNDTGAERIAAPIRLLALAHAPVDQNVASVIEVLQEHLTLAREGKLRSIAIASVSDDGSSIATQWSCAPGDPAALIGKLTVLVHDLMAARR
jgi:hypothetical protein